MTEVQNDLLIKAVKKLLKAKDGIFLIISINDKVNPRLLNKKISFLLDNFNINKNHIIIDKDENNTFNIPIFFVVEKKQHKLNNLGVYAGYDFKLNKIL